MAKKSYPKAKNRSEGGQFFALPTRVLAHDNFIRLTTRANKLFLDLCVQYNGKNNGDLTATFSIMKKRNWKSKETLHFAIDELLHYGLITRTRVGGMNKSCHLYAFTWLGIDECNGKLDCKPTDKPVGSWQTPVDLWKKPEGYKAIDDRRKLKSGVRNTGKSVTEYVPMALVK